MADETYRCLCHNKIFADSARFRSFNQDGSLFDSREVRAGTKDHLRLPYASDNTVKAEYYDFNDWQNDGCYPVNDGDHIVIDGSSTGFQVSVNGKNMDPGKCPGS